MKNNFSEKDEMYTKRLMDSLKDEYEKPKMTKEQLERLKKRMEDANMENRKKNIKKRSVQMTATAAALVGAFIVLPNTSVTVARAMEQIPVIGRLAEAVTFRNYDYASERNMASIEIPSIESGDGNENLDKTNAEINAEIKEITDRIIKEFEAQVENEAGYQDVAVKGEVLATTEDYFTLKLICYRGAGSGYEWNYYYTVDLNTGERLKLKDVFKEGSDYITPISENIKNQMKQRMAEDDGTQFWLNEEVEEWNFKSISDETSFYINKNNNVVIGFDEGEVAPMYMGTVEFEIPAEVIANIRK